MLYQFQVFALTQLKKNAEYCTSSMWWKSLALQLKAGLITEKAHENCSISSMDTKTGNLFQQQIIIMRQQKEKLLPEAKKNSSPKFNLIMTKTSSAHNISH